MRASKMARVGAQASREKKGREVKRGCVKPGDQRRWSSIRAVAEGCGWYRGHLHSLAPSLCRAPCMTFALRSVSSMNESCHSVIVAKVAERSHRDRRYRNVVA